jgi:hypothetical protein
MTQMPSAFGLYPSTRALHFGAEALRAARFRQTDISVLYSDGTGAFRIRESLPVDDSVADEPPASIGVILTSLSGLGAFAIPNDGQYVAAGPILTTLVDSSDSLPGSLRGLGLPESEISPFEDRLRQGGLLLSVQCDDDDWAARARRILENTGAERVSSGKPGAGRLVEPRV